MKNIVEIYSLGEDLEKNFIKDSPAQEEENKLKDMQMVKSKMLKWSELNHLQRIRDTQQVIPKISS